MQQQQNAVIVITINDRFRVMGKQGALLETGVK